MSYGVVVDIGGSGTRLAVVRGRTVADVRTVEVGGVPELVEAIRAVDVPLGGVGVSVAGRVDSDDGRLVESRAAAWAEGPLRDQLIAELDVPVSVIGSGDAHALSMALVPGVEFGGVTVSLGSTMSFGALDRNGALIRPCGSTGWDLGLWRLTEDGSNTEAWWGLGGHGLYDLERELGDAAPERFAYRLAGFLVDVVQVFRPRTILLTGGVVIGLGEHVLRPPVEELLLTLPVTFEAPRVVFAPSRHTALYGAAVAAGLR